MLRNRESFFSAMPPVTKNMIIINFIVWLAMILMPRSIGAFLMDHAGLHYIAASDFNIAQVVTYMFIHSTDSIAHLFFNMFTLVMFGITLERVFGSQRFLIYYLSCGIGAAIVQELTWLLMSGSLINNIVEMHLANVAHANGLSMAQINQAVSPLDLANLHDQAANMLVTVGASGAIYGVLLAFGMMFPNRPLYLMFVPVPIKAKWMVIGYGVIELIMGLAAARDGVAHFAHLGGMIFGFLLIVYWRHRGIINKNGYY